MSWSGGIFFFLICAKVSILQIILSAEITFASNDVEFKSKKKKRLNLTAKEAIKSQGSKISKSNKKARSKKIRHVFFIYFLLKFSRQKTLAVFFLFFTKPTQKS